MSRSLRQALLGSAGAIAVAASLPWLAPIDDALYRALQFARGCDFARAARYSGLAATLALLAAGALLLRRRPPLAVWARAFATTVGGALAVEFLKVLFERLRPNQMPDELIGNAFPSGHVTSTTIIALALWIVARSVSCSSRERRMVLVLCGTAVLSQSVSRLVFGAHWPSDVIASMLIATAWIGTAESLTTRTFRRPLRWAAGGALAVAVIVAIPTLRIPLPTPYESDLTWVDFDRPADRQATRGDWRHGDREPAGTVAWLRATAGAIMLPAPPAPPAGIGIGLRPTARGSDRIPGCVVATVAINEWTAPPISLLAGWREIRLRPPPSAWRASGNQLRFALEIDPRTRSQPSDFGWLGVRTVRVGPP